ncbi:MAG: tetratricopeptide repeat protein [Phycisphaerae bacterium]|nr:tetratricopeptide repeat protein [Phycisphaerae bacterium]
MNDATSPETGPVGGSKPSAADDLVGAGLTAQAKLDRWGAIEQYRKALTEQPTHPGARFHLAYNLDLVGEEDEAVRLYEQVCQDGPAPLNALVNLAVMYEDQGLYEDSERCLQMVLDTDPNHNRARLYMKDVVASGSMYYEEESRTEHELASGVLDTPVTDFDLSVRARNCLKRMNIRTVGDLMHVSEAELMDYKNLGESTLDEIRQMLARDNLKIGQGLEQRHEAARNAAAEQLMQSGEDLELLKSSVDALNLSVRARKALDMLSINTVGDLVARTEAELLGIKNFGATSLDEIKAKLVEQGLSLRRLDDE